jgi:asparagine synthetase B (glutamine-hydrolysing)
VTVVDVPALATLRYGRLRLDLRPSVAVRERSLRDGVALYLSLLDDEIDDRFNRFMSGPGVESSAKRDGVVAAAAALELTDAVVIAGHDGEVVALRGGSCTFPLFWSEALQELRLSTMLPLLDGARFWQAGLASALVSVCLHGSYEANSSTKTPLRDWHRVRRGTVTIFDEGSGGTREEVIIDRLEADGAVTEEGVAEEIRKALADYALGQRYVSCSVLELSGGFDSTLAGAAARRPDHLMHGISVEFPYYEFRFEADVQRAVAARLGIARAVLDGEQLFPYAPCAEPPRFDEPTLFVTGARHAERVARFAHECGANRIYVGHGGDQLFATDLTTLEPVAHRLARAAFSRDGWRVVRCASAEVRNTKWRRRSTGCFVYDGRQDVWVKESYGASVRTPFSDRAFFRAARLWSIWNTARNARPDKTILSRAAGELLPPAVTDRKGKVAYDGVWMRAYSKHADQISDTISRTAPVLAHLGLSPPRLLRQADLLAAWRPARDREVLAAYAVSSWLLSWGIESVGDVVWA